MTAPVTPAAEARDRLIEAVPCGIIDPDYARVFTIARCLAWQEGYAIVMHGSFTRDLDLLAVPWTDDAIKPEHLVKRIALALDDLDMLVKDPAKPSQATQKPHGRLAWTFTFKTFGDPRFIDLSVMPRVGSDAATARIAALEAALEPVLKFADARVRDDSLCTIQVYGRELRAIAAALQPNPGGSDA